MRCLVTAGPTFEPLDQVRRLTNFSTGRLGTELAKGLARRGHAVTLLLGTQATWAGERQAAEVELFTTTADLRARLERRAGTADAMFHAAAVSDFCFGRIWARAGATAEELPRQAGKFSTRDGALLVELLPTPKLLPALRDWFPRALIVGWKYEVEGGPQAALASAARQLAESRTDACVLNGPAWGAGFGLLRAAAAGDIQRLADSSALCAALAGLLGD